jgi:cytochrome c biogenesis protein CcmG/thiol:disulfide interchange protein DsbE
MTDTRKGASRYDDIAKRTTGHHPKLGWMIGGATAAVVLVIFAVVFLWPSDDGGDSAEGTGAAAASSATQEVASVQISGEDLPALPETGGGEGDPAVGFLAPTLTGQSFDESEVVIDPADGAPKMVVFVAHWCSHCQAEVPVIQDWIESGSVPEGMEIYSVSTAVDENRPNYKPSNWISSVGFEPQVMVDDSASSAAASYGLTGFPYFVMLDAEGNVWHRASGEIGAEQLQQLADGLVAGDPPPTAPTESTQQSEVDLQAN